MKRASQNKKAGVPLPPGPDDIPVTPERSAQMALVRSLDTKPEMRVRRAAHKLGLRYRLHVRSLAGCPDLVFPGRKAVLFVHGCFWHRHPGCCATRTPKTRVGFWEEKFAQNIERDRRARRELRRLGWKVLTIWECETLNPAKLAGVLERVISIKPASEKP